MKSVSSVLQIEYNFYNNLYSKKKKSKQLYKIFTTTMTITSRANVTGHFWRSYVLKTHTVQHSDFQNTLLISQSIIDLLNSISYNKFQPKHTRRCYSQGERILGIILVRDKLKDQTIDHRCYCTFLESSKLQNEEGCMCSSYMFIMHFFKKQEMAKKGIPVVQVSMM